MTEPTCCAQVMLAMLPKNSTAEMLLNAAEAHLILCEVHRGA